MTSLIDHFEQTLGPIQGGWQLDPDGKRMPFQVVHMGDPRSDRCVSYATLGLSRHSLHSSVSGRVFREEFLILAPQSVSRNTVVSLLVQMAEMAHNSGHALLRGEVIGPLGPIVAESEMTAFYASAPAYFSDDFAVYNGPDVNGDVVIVWLIPISTREAEFVSTWGWQAFEEQLATYDPDLVDFWRQGLVIWQWADQRKGTRF